MKYAVISVINGNYRIEAEGFNSLDGAKVFFAGKWQTLLNTPDVITAEIAIVDENLDCVENYKEFISHEVQDEQIGD